MYKYISVSNYVVQNDDTVIECSCGVQTNITMPYSSNKITPITIKKIDASANTIVISPAGSETISGIATYTVSTQNEWVTLVAVENGYKVIDVGGTNLTETLANKTLTSPTLTTPKIVTGGSINDAGGDEYIKFTEGTTPVTYIGITSGNTTVAPQVRGAGETNTDLILAGTGTGNVLIGDGTDITKKMSVELSGATTAKTMTITSSQTDDRNITLPDATDTLVGKATTDTLTNKTLTAPKLADGGFIADANGNEVIKATATASAVNEITVTNSATGQPVAISTTGSDTNIGLTIAGKGTGSLNLGQATSTGIKLVADQPILDSSGNELVKFVKSATAVNEVTITNAATTVEPTISVTGGDANISLSILPKGTGSANIGAKFRITPEGGMAIKLTNKTGGVTVKGEVVDVYNATAINNAVKKIVVDVPAVIGVLYESGIADGAEAWVVVSGIADVYFVGDTTRGHFARGFLTGDAGYVAGQALSEAFPTSPFASDKHFFEIGHVLESRTGAGLAKCVLHFN